MLPVNLGSKLKFANAKAKTGQAASLDPQPGFASPRLWHNFVRGQGENLQYPKK